jgi:hypothetical protein
MLQHFISVIFTTKFLIWFPHIFLMPHIYIISCYLIIKIDRLNTFRSHCCVLISVATLRCPQKYHYCLNSFTAARKYKGCKLKIYALGAHPQVSLSKYAMFRLSMFLGSWVRALTHSPIHIIFYLLENQSTHNLVNVFNCAICSLVTKKYLLDITTFSQDVWFLILLTTHSTHLHQDARTL